MTLRIGLFGFGKNGSAIAKIITEDPTLSLEWICRKTLPANQRYASTLLGYEREFAPFIEFWKFSDVFLECCPVDIVIDYSTSEASLSYNFLAKNKVKIISTISKYEEVHFSNIKRASESTAILFFSPQNKNHSLSHTNALHAAKWLANQSSGIYTLEQYLTSKAD